jgi:hypothetical protein
MVEFFQRGDRHVDVVLLEAEQAGGVVHQHVGVQNEQLGLGGGFSRHGLNRDVLILHQADGMEMGEGDG